MLKEKEGRPVKRAWGSLAGLKVYALPSEIIVLP